MEPSTPSRRGTFDLPKPETGLAEWTSRIKALQQQVDADEEAEQKRLQDEIAAARRARLRRSRGYGYGADYVDSPVSSSQLSKSPSSEVLKSSSGKRHDHDNTLRRLTSSGSPSPSVDTSSITQGILPRPSQFPATQLPTSKRPDPVSLASFIGGRATGPRLNRHAPQQDAHDPTQFEQRNINAPHPIFGKGGVAMPGMVTKSGGMTVKDAVKAADAVERYQPRQLSKRSSTPSFAHSVEDQPSSRPISPQKSGSRDRTISTPSATATKPPEQVTSHPLSPQKSGNRERTLSTPGASPSITRSIDNFSTRPIFPRPNTEAKLPHLEGRSRSPVKERPLTPSRSITPPEVTAELQTTPRQLTATSTTPASPARSLISTPSLARAIRPEPRPQPQAPLISIHTVPSPAFQRSPAQKDPTPSISRLQGRGFVQNMVKASAQLESPTKSVPSSPASRPSSARKSSVLERWQPTTQPTSSPTPSPKPRQASPVRKALSEFSVKSDPSSMKTSVPTVVSTTPSPSHPHLHPDPLAPLEPLSPRRAKMAESMLSPDGNPGLGSATTMVVYKPKTPEPPSSHEQPSLSSGVDELGVRRDPSSDGKGRPRFSVPAEIPGPSGKPLNHPTKDRARKPKKSRDVSFGVPAGLESNFDTVKNPDPLQEITLPSPQLSPQPPPAPSFKPTNEVSIPSRIPLGRSPPGTATESLLEKEPTSQVTQIAQRWGHGASIGVGQITSSSSHLQMTAFQSEIKPKVDSNFLRRVSPGTTNPETPPQTINEPESRSPDSSLQILPGGPNQDLSPSNTSGYTGSPNSTEEHTKSPSSPKLSDRPSRSPSSPKHVRIPSTGNRALVMDVAQALNEYNATVTSESIMSQEEIKSPVAEPLPDFRIRPGASPPLERRRSSYDRFSVVSVMPPLKEEATPNGTPFGTLTRDHDTVSRETICNKHQLNDAKGIEDKEIAHLDVSGTPLSNFDILQLLQLFKRPQLASPDTKTISVDILAINSNSSTAISSDTDIFYDSELLVIIHRYKSLSSGLVSTQLWVWRGNKKVMEQKEERKVQELAKRFNTLPTVIHQNSEPPSLVHLLGGKLVIRQGNRSHWSADNTTMFSIRSLGGVIFIDEHDFSVKNLCSAFSYCLTILDKIYLWHGCGSTDTERQAAVQYAARISQGGSRATPLHEGQNDQDELFWMALGDDEFARADYWQWRRHASEIDPRIWRVDAKTDPPIVEIQSLREESNCDQSIYIIGCVWEYFIQVGSGTRSDRNSIKLALNIAESFSEASASFRPFTPTVHVLVLPSRLPLDLMLNLRELNETEVNNGEVPDHMNLLSSTQARNHLHQHSWDRFALQDQTMLPLGISASHVI